MKPISEYLSEFNEHVDFEFDCPCPMCKHSRPVSFAGDHWDNCEFYRLISLSKQFLEQALQDQRQEIMDKVEELKEMDIEKEGCGEYSDCYIAFEKSIGQLIKELE